MLTAKKKLIKELKYNLDAKECEVVKLRKALDCKESEIRQLRLRFSKAMQENARLSSRLHMEVDTAEELRAECEKLFDENKSLKTANGKMREQLKGMHKARCEAIGWKREAQRQGANFNALMATYSDSEEHNMKLSEALHEAAGKLEVYDRIAGARPLQDNEAQ